MRQEDDFDLIKDPGEAAGEEDRPRPELELTRQEKRWIALGALKSGLLIGTVYLVVLGFLIWLMVKFWT